MRKRYLFLGICVLFGLFVVYFGRVDDHVYIEEFDQEIDDIRIEGNQTIEYAEEVLEVIMEQKVITTERIESLDEMVYSKELTIEDKMKEVNRLLIQANKFKEMAEDNADMAKKKEIMSIEKQMVDQKRLNDVLMENKSLVKQIKLLQQIIKDITPLSDEVVTDTIPTTEGKKDKKRGRKKEF